MTPLDAGAETRNGPVRVRRVEVVVNAASGSVGPEPRARVEQILSAAGVSGRIHMPEGRDIVASMRRALEAGPDLLAVVAGDGTARCAAELAGWEGPLLAPLPGGTMNMLPRALYGERTWEEALAEALAHGHVRPVSGGQVGERRFYVAAMIGAPALFALAREAVREGRYGLAWRRARRALRRTLHGSLHISIEGASARKAEALALMCPLVSTALHDDDPVLEAAALDPHGAREAMRLGVRALLGGWREDPAVEVARCRHARVWARGRLPATIDGEPVLLNRSAEVVFHSHAFRALAPPPPEHPPAVIG